MILHPGVLDTLKNDPDPGKTLRTLAATATKDLPPPPLIRDSGIYYIVVIALGIVAVLGVGGAIYLTASAAGGTAPQIPDTVTALASAAIGAPVNPTSRSTEQPPRASDSDGPGCSDPRFAAGARVPAAVGDLVVILTFNPKSSTHGAD
jgi:hypothetical protein